MKSGVFTQMYVQMVYAVKNREAVLNKFIRGRVFEYISGIVKDMKHKSIVVGGASNHVNLFMEWNSTLSMSDTVKEIKHGSSLFIIS